MHWPEVIGYVMCVLVLSRVYYAQTLMCHRMNTSQTVQSTMPNSTLRFHLMAKICVTKENLPYSQRMVVGNNFCLNLPLVCAGYCCAVRHAYLYDWACIFWLNYSGQMYKGLGLAHSGHSSQVT